VRTRRLGYREALEHVVERDLQELGDPEGDRRADLGPALCHFNALAMGDRQRTLNGEPVTEPGTKRLQRGEHVALLVAR